MAIFYNQLRMVLSSRLKIQEFFRSHMPILLILLLAVVVRLAWAWSFTWVIHSEGAEYARIAQNLVEGKGYVGIVSPGKELMFPPLLPLLIAMVWQVVHDYFIAGQIVCISMGALLVLPIFSLCKLLYDNRVATVGALIAGLHPLLLHISCNVSSEGPYMTLLMTAAFWSLRAMEFPRKKSFLLAGVFFGLAYLTRPEAFMYPFLAIALILFLVRQKGRGITVGIASLLVSFFIVASPYIAFLWMETGQFRLEGKSAVVYLEGLEGADSKSHYLIGEDLTEHGSYMRSNLSVIKEAHPSLTQTLHLAVGAARRNLPAIANVLVLGNFLGSPVLFTLVIIGLFRKVWSRDLATRQLFLGGIMLVAILALLSKFSGIGQERYYYVFLPVLIIWASKGAVELSRWAAATGRILIGRKLLTRHIGAFVRYASVGTMLLVSLWAVQDLWEFKQFGPKGKDVKEAGVWLRSVGREPMTIMDTYANLALHANANFLSFPECDSAVALRYLDSKGVDFIVIREKEAFHARYLPEWLEKGIPDKRAQLIYTRKTPLGKLLIFQWNSERRSAIPLAPLLVSMQ